MAGFSDANGIWRETTLGIQPINIYGWLAAGTALAAFADGASPTPGLAVDNSEAVGIRWNNHATPAAVFTRFSMPRDRQPNTLAKIRIMCTKSGATVGDATTFTIACFNNPKSALHDADANFGGASSAITGNATAKTMQEVTLTLAATDLANATETAPCDVSISFKPTDALLGTDDITVTSMVLEYTKIIRPA